MGHVFTQEQLYDMIWEPTPAPIETAIAAAMQRVL